MQTTAQITARLKILDFRKEVFEMFSDTVETSIKLNWQRTHSLECTKFVNWQLGHFLFIEFGEIQLIIKNGELPFFPKFISKSRRNAKTFSCIKLFKLQKITVKFNIFK